MKNKNQKNIRPKSCTMNNITINKNINKHIPIKCERIFSSNNFQNNTLEQNKSKFPRKSPYLDKFKSQLKRVNMYKEMWDKSFSNDDELGISQTIQINPENIPSNLIKDKFVANATSTRKNSGLTYNDIGFKSKRIIRNIKSNKKSNLWRLDRNFSNNMNTKSKTNNKISTNTFIDIYHDKENLNNFSKYNTTIQTNKMNVNTDLSNAPNFYDTNLSNNNSNTQEYFNYGVPKKKKKKDVVIINENKKSADENDDKNYFENVVRENNNNTSLNLRTEYLIKLSKLLGIAKKFIYSMDFFRIEKRDIFSHYMKNLTMAFDACNDILINHYKEGEIMTNELWSKSLSEYYNLSFHLIKFQNYAFQEMHFLKNENLQLKQKLYGLDGELNTKKKEIYDINKYIVQYDLTNKVKYKKKKEMTIQEIKQKYNSQESTYVLTINRLENEVKQLTEVLNKNKFDTNNFNQVNENLQKLKEEFEENKTNFDNQISEKIVTIKVLTQTNIDLNEKITELELEIQKNKEKEEDTKLKFIEYDSKIENLNEIIKQRNNLIDELKEEMRILKEKKSEENKVFLPAEMELIPPRDHLRKKFIKNS